MVVKNDFICYPNLLMMIFISLLFEFFAELRLAFVGIPLIYGGKSLFFRTG